MGLGLRNWSVSQQIGLLFVIIFGLLTLVTLVAVAHSMRTRKAGVIVNRRTDGFTDFVRDLRAAWLGTTLFWVAWALGAVVSNILFAVLSFLALREFVTLTQTRRGDHRSLLLAFFIVLPVQYVIVATRQFDLFTVFIPVYVFLAIPLLSAFGNDPQRFFERAAKIQWGVMVCVYGMSHAPALLLLDLPHYEERGAFLVLYLVLVVAAAQLGQSFAARRMRRRPVARHISRDFSWPAWWVGALSAALVGGALYWITPFKPIPAVVAGFIAGGSGSFGAFVMQALKRDAGVRSWGASASITGAVGLLDRIAPLCFAAPVFFHSVRWYFSV